MKIVAQLSEQERKALFSETANAMGVRNRGDCQQPAFYCRLE
jgi:hypothetical protein